MKSGSRQTGRGSAGAGAPIMDRNAFDNLDMNAIVPNYLKSLTAGEIAAMSNDRLMQTRFDAETAIVEVEDSARQFAGVSGGSLQQLLQSPDLTDDELFNTEVSIEQVNQLDELLNVVYGEQASRGQL